MAKKSPQNQRPLDRTDRRILNILQKEGRISFVDLANKVGLSTSPCLERVRRLEQQGIITGYSARIDPKKVGASLLVFVELSLDYTSPDIFNEFRQAVQRIPEVLEFHMVSGDCDYILKLRVNDMHGLRDLLEQLLHAVPGAVRDSRTLFVMEECKETSALPLEQ